ncbi:MAG: hypothetical protein WCU88_00440 [Elusimicrobiota bacterium]|jgi:hypothetical protein
MIKIRFWVSLSTALLLCAHPVHAFDPAPLLRDTTGVMKLMGMSDGKRSIYASIEDTKDYFRAEIVGREIRDEGNGKYRFDMVLPSTHSGSNPFWLRVSSSGVYIEHDFDLAFGGKVPFLLIPLNGQAQMEWRKTNDDGEEILIATVVGATETIKTPSGEYAALKVEYGASPAACLTEPCDGCTACEAFWFSPGTGLVAYADTSGGAQYYLIAQGGKNLSLDPRRYEASMERFSKAFPRIFK